MSMPRLSIEREAFAACLAGADPRLAFCYGPQDPVRFLGGFDAVVLDPGHRHPLPVDSRAPQWLAYLSLGEILSCAPGFTRMPPAWRIGRNADWGSWIIDQAQPGWPGFLVEEIARPIWWQGYQGFFLDTVDSYALLEQAPDLGLQQRAGLVRTVLALREAFPTAVIVLNRGFELLPSVHHAVDAVAFESLYQGWNQAAHRYQAVAAQDRDWLLAQAEQVSAQGLPVIAIDYCPPQAHALARDTRARIRRHGLVACIEEAYLQASDPDQPC